MQQKSSTTADSFVKLVEDLYNHKWSFLSKRDDESFYSFMKTMEEERNLYVRARALGPRAVAEYHAIMRQSFFEEASKSYLTGKKDGIESQKEYINTGDAEFDHFRTEVIQHDWYADFSDDIKVWRRAKENLERLEGILKEKVNEPKYKMFFDYYRSTIKY